MAVLKRYRNYLEYNSVYIYHYKYRIDKLTVFFFISLEKSSLASKLAVKVKTTVKDDSDKGQKVKSEILIPDTPASKKVNHCYE